VIETNTLRIERTFQASAEAVFDAWTSEEVIRRWWQAEHDWETTEAEVDLRVGGVVRVVMRDPNKDVDIGGGGRYTEIDWLSRGRRQAEVRRVRPENAVSPTRSPPGSPAGTGRRDVAGV
jgi:uncharacterized protein YndB with AHSA1/START domain